MSILTIDDHDHIRAAIDAALTADDLGDDIIASLIYRPAAEAEIVRRDPRALTRTGAEGEAVHRAAIYLCASLLCTAAPLYQSQTIGRWSGSRAGLNPLQRAGELRSLFERELATVLETSDQPDAPPLFRVARGRWYARST